MLITDLQYFTERANYTGTTIGIDNPNKSLRTKQEWHAYPIQNFDYYFNSWGFRGPEYDQYIGKPVNICLGDSYTINIGGPVEYSWCSQLAKYFNIPTLNLGISGAGNDTIRLVYDRACELFDVQNTFVMYTFFHRRLKDKKLIQVVQEDSVNFEHFLEQRIKDAYEVALPDSIWQQGEKDFLDKLKIYRFKKSPEYYSDHKETVDKNRKKYILEDSYNNLRSNEWPKYKDFIKGASPHPDMLTKEFGGFLIDIMSNTNRDGFHMDKQTNKIYADYFYHQWKQHNFTG